MSWILRWGSVAVLATGWWIAVPGVGGAEEPEAAKKIEQALSIPITLEFAETPLADVVSFLGDSQRVNVVLDQKALDESGIGSDTPVTMRLKEVSFESALELLLNPLDLTWMIRRDVLVITTPERAEAALETKVYPVADLVSKDEEEGGLTLDDLADTIASTVDPSSWDEAGGAGAVRALALPRGGVLVIAQTCPVHRKIAALLRDLRAAGGAPGEARPTPPPKKASDAK